MKDLDQLRYPIGKFEYGKKYSLDETRKHINILDRFPKDLKKMLKKLKGSALDAPYRPGGWTVRQVVHHLADSHINAYIRMKLAVTETIPTIRPYEENLWANTEDGKFAPAKISVKILSALHRRWVLFLSSLRQEDLNAGYYHPGNGRTVLLQEAIALYVWHSQHHLAHIALVTKGKSDKISKKATFEKIDVPALETVPEASAAASKPSDAPSTKTKASKGPKEKPASSGENKRVMSEEHKAKIRAGQAKRWGKTIDGVAKTAVKAAPEKVAKTKEPKVKKAPVAKAPKTAKVAKSADAAPKTPAEKPAKVVKYKAPKTATAPPASMDAAVAPKVKKVPAVKAPKAVKAPVPKVAKAPKVTDPTAPPKLRGRPKLSDAAATLKAPKVAKAAKSTDTVPKAKKVPVVKAPKVAKEPAPKVVKEPKVKKAPAVKAPKVAKAAKSTDTEPKVKKIPAVKAPKAVKAPVPKVAKAPKATDPTAPPKLRGRPKKS